jgi:membrane protein involved in colicin uptake
VPKQVLAAKAHMPAKSTNAWTITSSGLVKEETQSIWQHTSHQSHKQNQRRKDGVNEVEFFKPKVHKVSSDQTRLHQSHTSEQDSAQQEGQMHQVNEVSDETQDEKPKPNCQVNFCGRMLAFNLSQLFSPPSSFAVVH